MINGILENWEFGKWGLWEWNFKKLNLKNEILEDYFENRNFWKIGILENYFWKSKREDRSFENYILTRENKKKLNK